MMDAFFHKADKADGVVLASQSPAVQIDLLLKILWRAAEPIFLFDAKGGLAFANRAGLELTGLSQNDSSQARIGDLFRSADMNGVLTELESMLHGDVLELRAVMARGTGTGRLVSFMIEALTDSGGGRFLLCSLQRDRNLELIHQQEILSRISSEIISVKPLSEVLELVAKCMVDVAQVNHATITLVDENQEYFEIKVEHPLLASPSLVGARIPIKGSPTQEGILKDMKPVLAHDLESHAVFKESPRVKELSRQLDIKSFLIVPMVYKDRVIGTISVDSLGVKRRFTDDLVHMYQAIANQAAVAIENARLFETGKRLTRQAQLLLGFRRQPDDRYSLERVADRILSELRKLVEFKKATLQLIENDGRVLLAAAGFDKKDASPRLLERVEHDPIIKRIIDTRRTVTLADTARENDWRKSPETWDVNSWMGIPLVVNDDVIAILTLDHSEHGYYGRLIEGISVRLKKFAEQAAFDMHTAVLQRQIQGLQLVQKVGSDILKAAEVDDVLKEIVSGAMQLTRRSSGVLYLVEQGRIVKQFSPDGRDHPPPRMNMKDGITQTVIAQKQIVEISNIGSDLRVNPLLWERYKSMVAIPLVLEDTVVGVLYLNGKEEGLLTDMERWFVSTLANQAAIVVERARLYQKIRDSEAEYHSLLDHIPQYVLRKDLNSQFTSANRAFCESLNKSLSEIVGEKDNAFYPPELAEKFVRDDQQVIRTGLPYDDVEEHCRANTGERIFVRVIKTPVLDASGKIIGVQAIFWDVTAEKIATERYRSLVEQSPDGIVISNKNDRVTLANPAAVRLLSVSTEGEINQHSILDYITDDYQLSASQWFRKLNSGDAVDEMMEMTIKPTQGRGVDVAMYARRLPGESGIQLVFHDLTGVKALLRENHHRVRDALDAVNRYLSSRQENVSTEVQEVFNAVQLRIQAMAEVHTLLLRGGGSTAVPMDGYLQHLTAEVLKAYGDAERVRCEVEAEDLRFDEESASACGQIVNELVSNALLHGLSGRTFGRINVRLTKRKNGRCLLSVADDGCGFCKEHKKSTGLQLVRDFVKDSLHGHMRIYARKGVRVVINFPLKTVEAKHGE